jgi:NAD(P)-dependent dehydrogenase (short-subunit alcohol dehydrogenase family)
MARFEGKVALVTGGNSGIGRAVAERFAAEGASVVLSGRRKDQGKAVAESIRASGGEATFVACDVSEDDQVGRLVAQTMQSYGRLDYASNNAAPTPIGKALTEISDEDYAYMMEPALRGVVNCLKYEIRAMQTAGGAIVNTSSYASRIGIPYWSLYCAAKAGVEALTRVAAHECADKNIRVNAVTLGLITTPMSQAVAEMIGPEAVAGMNAHIPMKRNGSPEEVADPILFLCSDAASYVTGETLMVDGGYHLP